jgi:hypothetical protein
MDLKDAILRKLDRRKKHQLERILLTTASAETIQRMGRNQGGSKLVG